MSQKVTEDLKIILDKMTMTKLKFSHTFEESNLLKMIEGVNLKEYNFKGSNLGLTLSNEGDVQKNEL